MIHPADSRLLAQQLPTGAPVWTRVWTPASGAGRFRFLGLVPGKYDLEFSATGRARVWKRGVEAGEEGLLVTLDDPRPVTVRVDVESEVELKQVIVLRGRLRPHPGFSEHVPRLRSGTYEEPSGWPRTWFGLVYGEGGQTDDRGDLRYQLWPTDELPLTLELDEGFGWIGVKGTTVGGVDTFPVGTGLVELTEGTYELTFHQVPGCRVEGRVQGITPDAELFVAIASSKGSLLTLDVRRGERSAMSELGAQGTFAFRMVPEGVHELRVGSKEELLAGRGRLRQSFEARAGDPVRLEVRF